MGMGKNTKTLLGANARKTILAGVNKVYEPVAKTFGPKGKNALIPRTMNRGPRNTNDGVSVSENVILKNPHEKLVADFFKEGAMKNKWLVGDGTTTTTIIGGHLVNAILKKLPDNDTPELGKSKSDDDVMAIGSGGPYALAAARALIRYSDLSATEIAREAMKIASGICIYTNDNITIEELDTLNSKL